MGSDESTSPEGLNSGLDKKVINQISAALFEPYDVLENDSDEEEE